MEFHTLVETLQAFGLPGIIAAALVLLTIFFAKRAGLIVTGNQARIANIVLNAIIFGLGDNPQSEGALLAVLSMVLSALAFTFLEWAGKKLKPA